MMTSVKMLLISTLFSSLLFGSYAKGDLQISTTQSIAEDFKITENKSVPLEGKPHLNLEEVNKETSNHKTTNSSLLDSPVHGTSELLDSMSPDNLSGTLRPKPNFSTSPPLITSFVSKLDMNSSVADGNHLPFPASTIATPMESSENFTTPANVTMKTPDNSSIAVSILPPAANTILATPMIVGPEIWHTTTSDSIVEFTPLQETTLQPTSEFTNNSKILSNTSDPQEENRNTGVVFGAILGAILGASLLSLVGYLLCGRRKTDSFSHRRLYDDRNEPVLRLDNVPETYDVSFGNSSYYNPKVNDSSLTPDRDNAHDGIPMDDIPPLRTSV